MTNLTNTISSFAMLALAALPIAALATASQAAPIASVRIADLSLATPEGMAAFHQRTEYAARKFCSDELSLSARANCRQGVKLEMTEKMEAVRTAQAARANTTFAAR